METGKLRPLPIPAPTFSHLSFSFSISLSLTLALRTLTPTRVQETKWDNEEVASGDRLLETISEAESDGYENGWGEEEGRARESLCVCLCGRGMEGGLVERGLCEVPFFV